MHSLVAGIPWNCRERILAKYTKLKEDNILYVALNCAPFGARETHTLSQGTLRRGTAIDVFLKADPPPFLWISPFPVVVGSDSRRAVICRAVCPSHRCSILVSNGLIFSLRFQEIRLSIKSDYMV